MLAWAMIPTGRFMFRGLWALIGIYLLVINLAAFLAMGLDKSRAKRDAWRIPERRLFLLAALGGAFGGIRGMKRFHHKTKHWYFRFGFPLLLVLNGAALGAVVYFNYFK